MRKSEIYPRILVACTKPLHSPSLLANHLSSYGHGTDHVHPGVGL